MKNKKEYQNLYTMNPDTKAYIVEVSLDDYAEIFNGWDASPLRKKDMEPELLVYLEQAGNEIPLKEKLEICFCLSKDKKDIDKEQRSIIGVKNNFRVVLFFINKTLKKYYRQIVTYILLSMIFILCAYTLRDVSNVLTITLLMEGLFIGGWFLLWEAFSLFFFSAHETKQRKKIFLRFMDSDVYFKDVE